MERIGRYQIISKLGRGAMGVVYRARDPKIGRELAVKTIRLRDHADPREVGGLRRRLFREARSAGQLSHPGIVTIFDADEQDGVAYITMELVEGHNLAEAGIAKIGLDEKLEFISDFLAMAGSALDYAHERGIVHRDIKPGNIMVTPRGIKIMDFGVARISSSELTQTGTVLGTPNYMSPEQVRGAPVDGRSDQFSLGVIVYELLTGEKPFDAGHLNSTLYRIVNENPTSPHRHDPSIPSSLGRVVLQAIAKRPDDRYDTCSEFAAAFARAAKGRSPQASRSLPVLLPVSSPDDDPTGSDEVGSFLDETADDLHRPGPVALPGRSRERRQRLLLNETEARESSGAEAAPAPLWPTAIFALLLVAIGALSLLLLRYPGLLDDPARLLETILSNESTPESTPTKPADVQLLSGVANPERETAGPVASQVERDKDDRGDSVGLPALRADAATESTSAETVGTAETIAVADLSSAQLAGPEAASGNGADQPPAAASTPRSAPVFFTSQVDGVLVTVDQNREWRCRTPCELKDIPLGEHKVVAMLSGYELQSRTITVVAEGLTVDLHPERFRTVLFVTSEPSGARIFLDGRDTGKLTNTQINVRGGSHSLRLVMGELSVERTVEVARGSVQRVSFRLGTR